MQKKKNVFDSKSCVLDESLMMLKTPLFEHYFIKIKEMVYFTIFSLEGNF
jgi:hypothetical protein